MPYKAVHLRCTLGVYEKGMPEVRSRQLFGDVAEWLIAPDCKSGPYKARWFESIHLHQAK